jgi:hypothetical protein
MVRDVSHAVRVRDVSRTVACLILDMDTGLARGISVGTSEHDACGQAIESALSKPAGPLPPAAPARVLCDSDSHGYVVAELARSAADIASPVLEVPPSCEAEDIFDSFVGHMSGREQPKEFPTSKDWRLLVELSSALSLAEPWLRWDDTDQFDLVVKVDSEAARFVAVVLGREGIQRGLMLSPGAVLSGQIQDWETGDAVRMPAGTLLFWLDPPGEQPDEFAAKAARYGWPNNAVLWPTWLAAGPGGLVELDPTGARRLTVAISAVLSHDQRRPQVRAGSSATRGEVVLADGQVATYTIR